MKWYSFGLLSLFVCTLSGLLGWYVGAHNSVWPAAAVAIVVVPFCVMCNTPAFKRQFSSFHAKDFRHGMLLIVCGVIYGSW